MGSKFKAPTSLPTAESADQAFKPSGDKPGLDIWRIEKFKVVRKAASDPAYKGKFFAGDAYIILRTRQKSSALERDIFFWLGKDSSQDEQGCAAYKTVELDEFHGGEPTQHREVQGHESNEFLDMFKGGVSYMDGGVESGFKEVKRGEYPTKLMHVKGRRHIHCTQVPLEPSSMNSGDVFILDTKHDIFQWNGKGASKLEKQKAMDLARNIRDSDHNAECAAKVTIIEQDQDDDTEFWKAFGKAKPGSIAAATDDAAHEQQKAAEVKLFHLSDASGKMAFAEITERPLDKKMLDTNDAYVLNIGAAGIFAWVGKQASPDERLHAMKYATDFISKNSLPLHTPVTRLNEGTESQMFKQFFPVWPEPVVLPTAPSSNKSKFKKQTFDHKAMLAKKQRELEKLPDDGSSADLTVWRMEKREMVEVPKKLHGQFYSGDSYVILYKYNDANDKEAAFIYFWQGHDSSQDEKADSAIRAKDLDDQMGGYPVQVRVVQGKEPPHFYKIFEGRMVVHNGGIGAGWKNKEGEAINQDSYDMDGTRLFHVRGTNDFNTRAIQVEEKPVSLNGGDCFMLETPKQLYLWFGKGCNGDEREFTNNMAGKIQWDCPADPEKIMEGTEPAEFWACLGSNETDGRSAYQHSKQTFEDEVEHEARLFQCSDASGNFWAEEIFDFDQVDLIEEDVMLLDTHREVFVWVGDDAKDNEKAGAMELAKNYVQAGAEVTGRKVEDTVFLVLKQGREPGNFTCHFQGWNYNKWSQGKTYEELKAELALSNPSEAAALVGNMDTEAAKYVVGGTKYPFEQLSVDKDKLPDGVDATQKEAYLSDEDFEKYFKKPNGDVLTRGEFKEMPKWKQLNAKKKAGLF